MKKSKLQIRVDQKDYCAIGRMVDNLRSDGLIYKEVFQVFKNLCPSIQTLTDFEILMAEVESAGY